MKSDRALPADNGYHLTPKGSERLESALSKGYRQAEDAAETSPRRWTEAALCDRSNLTRNTVRAIRHEWKNGAKVRLSNIRCLFEKLGLELEPGDTDPQNGFVPQEARLEPVRKAFLEHIRNECKDLNPRGVSQTIKTVTLPLEEVYVSLATERERERDVWREPRFEREEEADDIEEAERERFRTSLGRKTITQKVGLPQAVRESSRLTILGVPGSGKTTLTRFLAASFASSCLNSEESVADKEGNVYGSTRMPIRIRIAEYADAFRQNRSLSLEEFLPTAFKEARLPQEALAELFKATFDRGDAFVLLDGLDEVAEAGDRREISDRIDRFVLGLGAQNRALVTSRIVGYQEAQLGSAFTTYRLQEMDRTQIERFLRSWCVAVEKFQTPEDGEPIWHRKGDAEAEAILQSVDTNPGVQRLATNPLLLTVLALIQRNGARMPERRIELYETAAETLLRDWRLHQSGSEARVVEEYEAEEMLGPLAYWMHETEETGLISEKEARAKLCELHGGAHGKPPTHPDIRREVDDFLRRVREHTGLFVERAPGMYGFMHLTFEEYFAARDIVSYAQDAAERIYKHRHEPRWEEPIRLAIALERPRNATHLIRTAILAQGEAAERAGYKPSLYDEFLRRDLLLAARCIGDCTGVEPTLARETAEELVNICLNRKGAGEFEPLVERARSTLGALRDSMTGKEAEAFLLGALKDENEEVRRAAATALGNAGQGAPEAMNALLNALEDESENVRRAATTALGRIGSSSTEVVKALLRALEDKNGNIRYASATALGRIASNSLEAMVMLIGSLKDENGNVRRAATTALGNAGQGAPEAMNALLDALEDESKNVRRVAATALGRIGSSSTEVVKALLRALKDRNESVRNASATALGRIASSSNEIVKALLRVLEDKNWNVQRAAAIALGRIGSKSPEAMAMLIGSLKDENGNVRRAAATALGNAGQGAPEAMNALLDALEDESENVRRAATTALGRIGSSSTEVVKALIMALQDQEGSVRSSAARALCRVGFGSVEIAKALLEVLTEVDGIVRVAAAAALGSMGVGSVEVVKALLGALKDEDGRVRSAAAAALGSMGVGSVEVVQALLGALKDEDGDVRYSVWEALWWLLAQ